MKYLGVRDQGMIRNPTATGTRIPSMSVCLSVWSRKHINNIKRGLRATDVVKLANGFILFAVEFQGYSESWIFAYKCFKIAPRLIANFPMRDARIRVVGTRDACTYDVCLDWRGSQTQRHSEVCCMKYYRARLKGDP